MLHAPVLPVASPRYIVGFDLRRRPHLEADVLVIGGGVAGLCAALAAAEEGAEVILLVKAALDESNTAWAQGGVAAVLEQGERSVDDDLEAHIADTLTAGAGLCDPVTVRDILADGAQVIEFLRKHGCRFDQDGAQVALTREGGHSARRILHANGDATGAEICRSLGAAAAAHPRITIIESAFAIDVIEDAGRIVGALYYRREELCAALAGATVLATGGCGRLWRESTNPPLATGDGLAMAYRAGATLANLEFMQFHPTTLYVAGASRLLITEAMRGEGAVLRNQAGEAFMSRYHPQADLAPRDVVTRAILSEVRSSGFPHVWLDATALGADFLQARFPTIYLACARLGIHSASQWLPVHPSAHYHCGGVLTDANGVTSVAGLFAAGEVAETGLHGANRLASNSILEGLVMGRRAGVTAASAGGAPGRQRASFPRPDPAPELDVADLVRSLRSLMWRQVGIERNGADLSMAARTLQFWSAHQARGEFRNRDGWELQNQLCVGQCIAAAAAERRASVGTHGRTDSVGEPWAGRYTMTRKP